MEAKFQAQFDLPRRKTYAQLGLLWDFAQLFTYSRCMFSSRPCASDREEVKNYANNS